MYENKTYLTMQDLMEQMDISDKTLHRMIDDLELPPFTYGSRTSKKKGWHTAVLERHAMERYERSASFKNVSNPGQIRTEDVTVVPLGRSHHTVAKQNTHFDDRHTSKKKLSSKEMPKGMRPPSRKSRIQHQIAQEL